MLNNGGVGNMIKNKVLIFLLIVLAGVIFVSPVNAETSNWKAVNYSNPDLIIEDSLSVEEFNQLSKNDWLKLLENKEEISFAFRAIDSTGNDITSQVDSELNIIVNGNLKSSIVQFPDMKFKNIAPVISRINNQTIDELENFVFQVKATDINNDKLVYSLINNEELPLNLNMDQDGLIEWNTGYEDKGIYPLEVKVSDGNLSDTESFYLTVKDVNVPPQLSELNKQDVYEGDLLEFHIPANDIDNGILTFSSTNLPEGANLSADGLFSWKPDYTDSGEYTFTISVSDGVDSAFKDYKISVVDKNATPQFINIENKIIGENDTFNYQLEAADIDNDQLTYSLLNASDLPTGITFNNGFIEWKTDYDSQGSYDLEVQVSDGELTDTATLNLTVKNVDEFGLKFTGKGSYVDCGNDSSFDIKNEITLQVSLDVDKLPAQMEDRYPSLITKSNQTYNFVVYDSNTSKIGFRLNYLTHTHKEVDYVLSNKGKITITAVFDGSRIKLYENGKLKTSLYGNVNIRTDNNNVTMFNGWEGIAYEAQIWNKALSQSQIQENINKTLTGNEEGLVSFYNMNEGVGNTLIDKAGQNNCEIHNADYVLKN